MNDDERGRAVALADLIEAYVLADSTLTASIVGIGASAIVDTIRRDPDAAYADMAPIIRLLSQGIAYVETRLVGDELATIAGQLRPA